MNLPSLLPHLPEKNPKKPPKQTNKQKTTTTEEKKLTYSIFTLINKDRETRKS